MQQILKKKTTINVAYNIYKNQNNNNAIVQYYLTSLQKWAIDSYKIVMGLRKEITEQDFIYHIQDGANKYSYTLNENQFLQLLQSNEMSMSYAKVESLDKVIKEGVPLANLFKLQVNAGQKKLNKMMQAENGESIQRIELGKDALYQYLLNTKEVMDFFTISSTDENGSERKKISHSRLYEMYSQLSNMSKFKWVKDSNGMITYPEKNKGSKYFFNLKRETDIFEWIQKYAQSELIRDTTAFYKTGDAIQDNRTLIENKVGNAVVSVSTIYNAIKGIADLATITDKKKLESALKGLYTYKGKGFAEEIQSGASRTAKKAIASLFKKNNKNLTT